MNAPEPPGLPSVVAAATALVTGVGALTITGALGRVQRNHGTAFAVALAFVVVGAGLWLVSSLISTRARPIRIRGMTLGLRPLVQVAGVALSLIGAVVGFVTTVATADDTEQPTVKVKIEEGALTLTGNATVSNLSSEDRLVVYVDGLVDAHGGYRPTNLFQAFVGPDGDGKASADLDVPIPIPPGRFDAVGVKAFTGEAPGPCGGYQPDGSDGEERGTACVVAPLPLRPARPQLHGSWRGKGSSDRTLHLKLTVADAAAGGASGELLWLHVVGVRGPRSVSLYRATIPPAPRGATERELQLPIDSDVELVCAQARMIEQNKPLADAPCPIRKANARVAAIELRPRGL